MVGKQPTKAELSQLLQAQFDHAMLLDNSIHTLYASQPTPSKGKYRPRKVPADSFQEELARLKQAEEGGCNRDPASTEASPEAATEFDISVLEREAADFMRNRRRK